MVKLILGEKGSGKTKWLIDNANKDMKEGNGNIVFIDVDDNHIFTLNYNVRLINAMEFNVTNIESFYGFLCGLIGMDYDVEKIYVDSLYKVMTFDNSVLEKLVCDLNKLGEKFQVNFFINVDRTMEQIPESLKEHSIELELAYA